MERRAITIEGIVQGVGFRPFVCKLATQLRLGGFVRNQEGVVWIEVEGEAPALNEFIREIKDRPPPLAQIQHMSWSPCELLGDCGFVISPSTSNEHGRIFISPDVATCAECLKELFDPTDRHFRYPFLNCTNCGPRLTIIRGAPYDRPRTTMADFPMCPACAAEYHDPANRRFHAQPTACPACGPQLRLCDGTGQPSTSSAPLGDFARAVRAGSIGALKGLGGFHLTCAAANAAAVAELRRRKHRHEKPFAIMVPTIAAAEQLCECGPRERERLQSPAAPIVLLRKRDNIDIADAVAPGNPMLGIMLPYTPLHHLLLNELQDLPLVMTSGNASDEPIAIHEDDAFGRLAGIADLFLVHNRPIHVRCDDSVVRVIDDQELPLRRSRGFAPRPIAMPVECRHPILAVGGQLKGTFALGQGRLAFLSHHLGDLDHYDAFQAFTRDIELYQELLAVRPALIVHDLHPDYVSTGYATETARRIGCRLLSVQHHHAHMASCMAEHGLTEPVIGVTLDGAGFGPDGAIWGGEFLVGDLCNYQRMAHFRYVGMPGGDQATREPWRMAAAFLEDAQAECKPFAARILPAKMRTIKQMLAGGFHTPPTSSAGRLFDAVASLAGIRDLVSYEGQAAVELECLATEGKDLAVYPFLVAPATNSLRIIDTRPLIRAVAHDAEQSAAPATIARRFHSTMVEIIVQVCQDIHGHNGLATVVLTGGVFQNALLSSETTTRLKECGFLVYRHRLVPPNDGGLSLGQLAVAAARTSSLAATNGDRE